MRRLVLAFAFLAAVTPAVADTGMLPNGAELLWPRLQIRDSSDELVELPDSEALRFRLNQASCACSKSAPAEGDARTDLYYELSLTATTGIDPNGELWVGSSCDDDLMREQNCRKIRDIGSLDNFNVAPDSISVRVFDMINATEELKTAACREANEGSAFVWVNADTDNNGDLDFFSPRPIDLELFGAEVNGFDTKAPPLPTDRRATGGEGSIELSFTPPVGDAQDVFGYQAFCMDSAGAPVRDTAGEPLFVTTREVCGIEPAAFIFEPSPVSGLEGTEVTAAPAEFTALDPRFLCASVESTTAQSITIEGLVNGVEYTVALLAVDFYGNATGTFYTRTIIPKPVTDFWEDLHDRGSGVEGGFCASGGSQSGFATLLLVLGSVWAWRRRKRGVAMAAVVVIALVPRIATADEFTPYWEDPSSDGDGEGVAEYETPKWHAGFKLGPYVPAIDDQVGKNPVSKMGPYQAMFGNYFVVNPSGGLTAKDGHVYQIMPTLDVDRFLWHGSGQFGVGGSIGYMQKTALAYLNEFDFNGDGVAEPTSPDDPRRPRSRAGENTFRLIPIALTATYRATQLDDLWGIPVVPYIRGGLSYYIWWLKGPDGDISKVCKDGTMNAGCDANKAYGGTLGFQGSLGIAIRAERIDRDAARSMVNSGIYHAGFYAELMYAVVDGFGSDKKLSVGDKTWFAGVDFEF